MKHIVTLVMSFYFLIHSQAQTINFSKNVFKQGEAITATVIGELRGIENGVTNSSYTASQGILDLGKAAAAGFYRIDFKFANDVTKSFLIGVIGSSESAADQYNIPLTDGKVPSISENIAEKMLSYFRNETSTQALLAVSKEGLGKFCKENAVSLVSNVSFCLTTVSGVPVMATICQSLTVSNAKKLGIEVMKAFVTDMKKKNYLTETEYKAVILAIDATQLGAILKSNCSLIFKSLKALSNNQDLKIALGYFEQQCKTTVLIIETFKPLP